MYSQLEFESREALLAERRESEEHCKLLLIAQREKNKREEEHRYKDVSLYVRQIRSVLRMLGTSITSFELEKLSMTLEEVKNIPELLN